MKLAIVTDIHHGAPSATKRGDLALPLLAEFASFVRAEAPDLVLELGDRISDVDQATDLRLEAEVADAFAAIDTSCHHICGNHDRDHLSVAENEQILGQALRSEVLDLGPWQLALWRADAKIHRGETRGFRLPEPDFLWLARTLATATKPVLIATHVPASGYAQTGNYYFQNNPSFAGYPEAPRIRALLAQAPVPVVYLAGHVHWNTLAQIDGTVHLTQQSLTESFTTAGTPAAAWGTLTLGADVHWQVHGHDPFEARVRPATTRWTPPMGVFQ